MTLRRDADSGNSPCHYLLPGRNRKKRAVQPKTFAALVGVGTFLLGGSALVMRALPARAQAKATAPDETQKAIEQKLFKLRQMPDDERAKVTKQLALDIRKLASPSVRLGLASVLASMSTEGDFGRDTLQEATTTLAEALQAQPTNADPRTTQPAYIELAQLIRYEKMHTSLKSPQLTAALAKLDANDHRFQEIDFTLNDLDGKPWTLKSLRGKVVVVNFWATWCPPCRKELPDLQALYDRFKGQGLVVLGVTDEEISKVQPFVTEHKMTYPVLLDPGRKVNQLFDIQGIPRSLFYDRNGKLAAQAIDMRTQKQFLELLSRAGMH